MTYADLLQMTGRAGRRDIPGNAVVLCEPEKAASIIHMFRKGVIERIQPQLIRPRKKETDECNPLLSIILSEIIMKGKATVTHVNSFLNCTFSCVQYEPDNRPAKSGNLIEFKVSAPYEEAVSPQVFDIRKDLNELIRLKLVYQEEETANDFCPTKLGKTVTLTGISPESGALLAGFLRALIKLDEKHEEKKGRRFNYLRRLTDLDLIFLCCACFECRSALIKQPSKKAISDIQEFIETLTPEEKPIVNLWYDGQSAEYPTHRLLTTLRISFDKSKKGNAEKAFYKIMQSAILLYQHARGTHLADLATKFKASLGELENNLKFNVLWLLNCFSQICNPKRCYKLDYLMMRAFKLIECMSVGSKLGELMRIQGVGRRSVEKLIENDFHSVNEIEKLGFEDLIEMGIGRKQSILIIKNSKRNFR